MISLLLSALALAAQLHGADRHDRVIGKDTTIPFAAQHGLRDWQEGESEDVLYVQDYRLDWYRVRLSGPCIDDLGALRVAYTTRPGGTFDEFSHVYSTDFPERVCSVVSIKTSGPPPGRDHKIGKDK